MVIIYPKDAVRGGLIAQWSQSKKVGTLIKDFCKKNDIETLDLLNFMNGKQAKEQYFFKQSGYFSQEGNHIVAKSIYERLLLKHLLGDR